MKDKITVELTPSEFELVFASLNTALYKKLDDITKESSEKCVHTINTYQSVKDKFLAAYMQETTK